MSLEVQGRLQKMHTELKDGLAQYSLAINGNFHKLNDYLVSSQITELSIEFVQEINCIHCDRHIKKTFNQGYCFPCFRALAQCDSCIVSPEKCHFRFGTCREPEWAEKYCIQTHVCYIANSSGLKIGLTRATQLPTRWIDQGATQGLIIARVATRYQAGLLETICKQHLNDRTNWQQMLKQKSEHLDLYKIREDLYNTIEEELSELQVQFNNNQIVWSSDDLITEIDYPIIEYPKKVSSLDLEKKLKITGRLQGIKGQYLILDTGVINLRKYTGYNVKINLSSSSEAVHRDFVKGSEQVLVQ